MRGRGGGGVWLLIPTYNERENVRPLALAVRRILPAAHLLFVDDSSPDGTGEEVRRLARRNRKIHLLSRPWEVRGRGWAGREGFLQLLDWGARIVVEMDADGSHDPVFLPALVAPLVSGAADLVVGSRYAAPGGDAERSALRRTVSFLARFYLRTLLGLSLSDPTSGYRAYTREALRQLDPETLTARDPFTVTEVLHRAVRAGLRIREVPIVFRERRAGASKLRAATLASYLWRVLQLRFASSPIGSPSGRIRGQAGLARGRESRKGSGRRTLRLQ